MAIKKNDFVEIEYTGRLKAEKLVFDTTDEKLAKEKEVFNPNAIYGPVVICVGQNHVLRGLDSFIEGKEPGRYTVELGVESAFGKKDAKLIQMVPLTKFTQNEVRPFPGLQINIDGVIGTVRSVSGGRVLIDFNHPLAGKELVYELKINRLVTDKKAQVASLVRLMLGIADADTVVEGDHAKITLKPALPKQVEDALKKKMSELTGIKNIEFLKTEAKKEEKQKGEPAPKAAPKTEKNKENKAHTPAQ